MLNDAIHNELIDLAFAVCDGAASDQQVDRIEELIAGDPEARLLYLQCLELHFEMHHRAGGGGREKVASEKGLEISISQLPNPQILNPQPPVSIILDTTSPLAPLSAPLYSAHPFLFSNLISLLIVGIGLLGAWMYQVDIPRSIAINQRPSVMTGQTPEARAVAHVGQITGMVDCRWEKDSKFKLPELPTRTQSPENNKSQIPNSKFSVSLGDKFALASGLLEITYDTGAKVILEGPASYEVESRDGGFLTIGKLTAKLEKKVEGERRKGEEPDNQNSSLSTLHSPLFTIRTSAALITDLGTEFGVEVDRQGNVLCAVLQGEVQFSRLAGADRKEPAVVRLKQGQAARAVQNETGIAGTSFTPNSFVRVISNRTVASKLSQSLISTTFVKPSWWRYSIDRPNGDYKQPKFDDSYWAMSKAGFGSGSFHTGPNRTGTRTASPPIVTGWGSPDIWLRQEIVVSDVAKFQKAVLTLFSYGSVEIHINGKPLFHRSEGYPGYAAFEVTDALRAAIHEGVNVVAVHASRNVKDGAYIDLGLTLDPTDAGLPTSSLSPEQLKGKAIELVATADESPADWHWTTDRPASNWANATFDHSSWLQGKAGFGNPAELVPHISRGMIGTPWSEPDIWLRKEIEIDKLPTHYLGLLRIYHDEDVEVFVNGKLVFTEPGFLTEWKGVDITDRLRTALRPGRNVLAIHVHQTVGGQYIDAGLTLYSQ